ncbi:hypothetical protein [Streptomyces griseosporeus]
MEISFIDGELAMACNDDAAREHRYGPSLAGTLRRRLAEIYAAAHLDDLRRLPAARLRYHPHDGDLLLVSLGPSADLHMRPRAEPPSRGVDGTLHYEDVRAVVVVDVQPAPATTGPRPEPLRAQREAS